MTHRSRYEAKVGDPLALSCSICGGPRYRTAWADLLACPDCDEPALQMSIRTRLP